MKAAAFVLAVLPATSAAAETGRLFCMGADPRFLATIEGDTVALDYLGDGSFTLDPPLDSRAFGFSRHILVTARERWDLYLETRACPMRGADLPVSIEIAVPTSSGLRPFSGCCVWNPKDPGDASN